MSDNPTRHSEEAIIGVLINHPEEYLMISSRLSAKHFADDQTREFFQFFEDCVGRGKGWDEHLFLDKFDEMDMEWCKKIMVNGNLAYINNYIENVRLKDVARQLYKQSSKAQEINIDTVRDLVEEFYKLDHTDDNIITENVFDEVLQRLHDEGPIIDIPVNMADLNERIGGLARKQVYTIAGRPGHSKSMLMTNLITKPLQDGYKVLMADYEMPPHSIIERMLSVKFDMPLYWHKRRTQFGKSLDKDRKMAYKEFTSDMRELLKDRFQIIKHASMADIEANIIKHEPDIVTIDTIQALANSYSLDNNISEAGTISRLYKTFERMADKYNCNFIVCSQVNKRDDSILPSKGDLKGSGGIEESSSVILTVRNRETMARNSQVEDAEKYRLIKENRGQYDIAIRKNRHGEESERTVFYNKSTGRVSEIAIIPSFDEAERDRLAALKVPL